MLKNSAKVRQNFCRTELNRLKPAEPRTEPNRNFGRFLTVALTTTLIYALTYTVAYTLVYTLTYILSWTLTNMLTYTVYPNL